MADLRYRIKSQRYRLTLHAESEREANQIAVMQLEEALATTSVPVFSLAAGSTV
jgi:hypothetical protein